MIQTVLGVFLILLHIVCCVLVWLGIKTHLLKVKKYLMALVIFVPFWGTVCVLLLHLQMLTRRDNRIEPGVEKLRVNEEIYKNIFQAVSDTEQYILFCAVNKYEIRNFKKIVNEIDPKAFVTISEDQEIDGGFEKRL